jgi:hypothetical protein
MNAQSTTTKGGTYMSNRIAEPILAEDLEENLADDPYGTATFVVRNVIFRALRVYGGAMNATEESNLIAIEELLRTRDNA